MPVMYLIKFQDRLFMNIYIFVYSFTSQSVVMSDFRPVSVLGRGHFGKVSMILVVGLV